MQIPEAFKNFNRRLVRGGQKVLLAVFLSLIYVLGFGALYLAALVFRRDLVLRRRPSPGESAWIPAEGYAPDLADCRRQS